MQIAVFGTKRLRREELEALIRSCLTDNSELEVCQYSMEEPIYNQAPPDISAAFVIVDDANALKSLRTVARWVKDLPLAIVSDSPEFALEGVRLQVRHYLLFPLRTEDVREAMLRMGLEVRHSGENTDI